MPRQHKTSQKKRTNYIYYTGEGTKIVITPGENGVTEADIELLHSMDDLEVDKQRQIDYRTLYLSTYYDGEDREADDRNRYLADDSANSETILIQIEEEKAYQDRLLMVGAAMESLLPQQRALFEKVYVQRRTNTDIAAEEGVTEAAVRNRLKKIQQKLRKFFP